MSVSIKFADGGFGNGWIVDGLPVYLYDAEDMLVAMDYTIWDWGSDTGTVTLWYAVPGPQTLKVSFQMIGLMPGTNYATVDKIHHKELRYRKGEVVTQVCNGEGGDYRFGFNGMHKDNEVKGIGNSLDFGERWMDTRIGRLGMTTDPLYRELPEQSPYAFAKNNPIVYVDKEGKYGVLYTQIIDKNGNAQVKVITDKNAYAVVPGRGGLSWDTYHDFVQFAKIDLRNNTTQVGEPIRIAYVPAWERAARKVGDGFGIINDKLKPGPLTETFKKYYDKGGGGIRMVMSGAPWAGQGQETRIAEFPDNEILDISGIMSAFSVSNATGGLQVPKNFGQAVKYLRDATLAASDAQELGPIKVGSQAQEGAIYCEHCGGNFERKDGKISGTPSDKQATDTVKTH